MGGSHIPEVISDAHRQALRRSPYFADLDDAEVSRIIETAQMRELPAGAMLFHQGDPGSSVLIILEGQAEVFVTEAVAGEVVVQRLGPGESVGEMAVLLRAARTASVRAGTPLAAIEFDLETLRRLTTTHAAAITNAVMLVARQSAERLASANEQATRLVRRQVDTARFFIFMVLICCVYIVAADFLRSLGVSFLSTVLGIVVLALFAGLGFRVIRQSVFPPEMYGLTLSRAGPDLLRSLGLTATVLAALTATKAVLIRLDPAHQGMPLFGGDLAVAATTGIWPLVVVAEATMYAVHSIFQEFLVRGCMQSSLKEFTTGVYHGRRGTVYSIVISNGFFAVMHIHISITAALVVGSIGFLWGWMRSRQASIWGVCLSHILIGLWGFSVLAIQDVF